MGAVSEGSLPDVEPAPSDGVAAGRQEADQRSSRRPNLLRRARRSSEVRAQRESRRNRRSPGSAVFRLLRRMWIPLVVLAVIGAGGLTVSQLRGIFGSDTSVSYGDTRTEAARPFNPKHLTYEIFGPPGTVAHISYFDANGDPQFIEEVGLPWSLDFPITATAGIGSIAAQGDSDSIGCRILVDGKVKAEEITRHEASSFVSCILKAA